MTYLIMSCVGRIFSQRNVKCVTALRKGALHPVVVDRRKTGKFSYATLADRRFITAGNVTNSQNRYIEITQILPRRQ